MAKKTATLWTGRDTVSNYSKQVIERSLRNINNKLETTGDGVLNTIFYDFLEAYMNDLVTAMALANEIAVKYYDSGVYRDIYCLLDNRPRCRRYDIHKMYFATYIYG